MTIELYNNASDTENLVKSITLSETLTGSLRGSADVMSPEILIEDSGTVFNPAINYAYITEWGRYYYIVSKESYRNNLVILKLAGDPCMSFANNIKALSGIVRRQENEWNLYINDGSFMTYANDLTYALNFPSGLNGASFVLVTAGA